MSEFKVVNKVDVHNKSSISDTITMQEPSFVVSEAAVRPGGDSDKCYYCKKRLGSNHAHDCITIKQILRIPVSGTIVIPVPASFTPEEKAKFANLHYGHALDILIQDFWIENEVEDFQDYNEWPSYNLENVLYLDESK